MADQATAQYHHTVAALLLDACEVHQLGQVFGAGHDEHLILGHEFVVSAGDDGVDAAGQGHHPEREFMVSLGELQQSFIGQGRRFLNARGQHLNLIIRNVDRTGQPDGKTYQK